MLWVGIVIVVLAIVSLLFGLYESFISEGGVLGQAPVLIYAVAFPMFLTMAFMFLRAAGQTWAKFPGWILWVAFPVLVFLSGFLIIEAGKIGKWYHQRKK
jgi:hypothetical protein